MPPVSCLPPYGHDGTQDNLRSAPLKCSYRRVPWDFWLIFLLLGVLIPWRGRARLRRLLARPSIDSKGKFILYGSTIAVQWVAVSVVAWRALARGITAAQLGLAWQNSAELAIWSLVGAAILGSVHWFNLRRVAQRTGPVPDLMRQIASRILPTKNVELLPYCALAATAGMCEEFLYRGFAMAALSRAGIPTWAVLLISAALFGLAHAYQGRSGILGTALLGILFGLGRLAFASLVPVMVWHTAIDVVAGIAAPGFLLRSMEAK